MQEKIHYSKRVNSYTSSELNKLGKKYHTIMLETNRGTQVENRTDEQIDLVNTIVTSMLPVLETAALNLNNRGYFKSPYFPFAFTLNGVDASELGKINLSLMEIVHEGACQVIKNFHKYNPKRAHGSVYSFVLIQAATRMKRYILKGIPNSAGIVSAIKKRNQSSTQKEGDALPYIRHVNLIDMLYGNEIMPRRTNLEKDFLKSNENPEINFATKRLCEEVEKLLDSLNPRERKILQKRYGLQGNHEKTLNELGESLKISRERTRQIQKGAEKKLREIAPEGLIELIR